MVKDLPVNPRHEPLLQAGGMPTVGNEEYDDLDFDKLIDSEEIIEDQLGDASKDKDIGTFGGTDPSS